MAGDRESSVHWVADEAGLREVGRRLGKCQAFALDTEHDAFHAYRPKVCVIQIGVSGEQFVIDALGIRDLGPIREALEDPARMTVAHAAENDVDLLRRTCGIQVRGLFDTMAAARRLGDGPCGLAQVLLTRLGVRVSKRFQRSDWRRRPLDDGQIEYAARDVRYLLDLQRVLWTEARRAGVERALLDDFRRIERTVRRQRRFRPGAFEHLPGARSLSPPSREALGRLYGLRERIAEAEDRAVFRVCGDQALVAVARALPETLEELEAIEGVSRRLSTQHGDEILVAVAGARRKRRIGPREIAHRDAGTTGSDRGKDARRRGAGGERRGNR